MSASSTFAALIFAEERFRGRLMDDEERWTTYVEDRLGKRPPLTTLKAETKPAERHNSKQDERSDNGSPEGQL